MIQRIAAQQHRRDVVLDHAQGCSATLHGRRLADTRQSAVRMDADERATLARFVGRRPVDLKGLYLRDLHASASRDILTLLEEHVLPTVWHAFQAPDLV